MSPAVGIDLGTTNTVVAVQTDATVPERSTSGNQSMSETSLNQRTTSSQQCTSNLPTPRWSAHSQLGAWMRSVPSSLTLALVGACLILSSPCCS
jgi:molecular chaperone DnaK (HSP70)